MSRSATRRSSPRCDDGLTPTAWADLELVDHFQRYLRDPMAYLRHIVE